MILFAQKGRLSDRQFTLLITAIALVLFSVMFIFKQAGVFDFWYWMSSNIAIILLLVFYFENGNFRLLKHDLKINPARKIIRGLAFAGLLFLVFFVGNILVRAMFGQAGNEIGAVYGFKQNAQEWRIVVLMLLIIGPGEEIFWRGFLLRKLQVYYGDLSGFFLATGVYTLVHVFTGNMILVLAAFTCGVFWGWLYTKYQSLLINIVSHTVWDILVFILLPFH